METPLPSATSFLDVIYKVPELLEDCVNAHSNRAVGMRAMRLVCKDFACSVIKLVHACSVQAGDDALPIPHEIARMMSMALLDHLDVTVVLRTGDPAPNTEQQLAVATSHANQLITGMGSAIARLTHLHLTVRNVFHNKRRLSTSANCISVKSTSVDGSRKDKYRVGTSTLHNEEGGPEYSPQVGCPPELEVVPRRVFEILSTALPLIQHLSLLGHCSDGALDVFGSNCPELRSLHVEASSVPIKALLNLHTHLPNLTRFGMSKRGAYGNNLQAFTFEMFAALGPCTSLAHLTLDLGSKVQIACKEPEWELLPPSITELQSSSPFTGLRLAGPLLKTLQTLNVLESPYPDLLQLLKAAPCLQKLIVQQTKSINLDINKLYNADGSWVPELDAFRKQLCTMGIYCPSFMLRAGSDDVESVMLWLRPISSTTLTIEVTDLEASPFDSFREVAFVFPNLTSFEVSDKIPNPDSQLAAMSLNEACLRPLMDCKLLKQLLLHMRFPLTMAGMFDLCMGLPVLENLSFYRCPGMDHKELQAQLLLTKPIFKITVFSDP